MALPINTHMPARLLDYDSDGLDEVWIIGADAKLYRVSVTGSKQQVCPNLSFHKGYGNKFGWSVNPALGTWGYYFIQGTRIYDLQSCKQVKAASNDVAAFGSVGDFDGDHAGDVDYYRLPGTCGLFIQLYSPEGLDYDFYWYGTTEDKLYAKGTSNGHLDQVAKCVCCTEQKPPFYVVKIVPKSADEDHSPARPYVLKINRIP